MHFDCGPYTPDWMTYVGMFKLLERQGNSSKMKLLRLLEPQQTFLTEICNALLKWHVKWKAPRIPWRQRTNLARVRWIGFEFLSLFKEMYWGNNFQTKRSPLLVKPELQICIKALFVQSSFSFSSRNLHSHRRHVFAQPRNEARKWYNFSWIWIRDSSQS